MYQIYKIGTKLQPAQSTSDCTPAIFTQCNVSLEQPRRLFRVHTQAFGATAILRGHTWQGSHGHRKPGKVMKIWQIIPWLGKVLKFREVLWSPRKVLEMFAKQHYSFSHAILKHIHTCTVLSKFCVLITSCWFGFCCSIFKLHVIHQIEVMEILYLVMKKSCKLINPRKCRNLDQLSE